MSQPEEQEESHIEMQAVNDRGSIDDRTEFNGAPGTGGTEEYWQEGKGSGVR